MRLRLERDDRGFTLIEMLIAVTLLGIIIVPLSMAMIVFFKNSSATTDRMAESHDVQIASAYFAQDVQSVGARDWTSPTLATMQSIDVTPFTGSFACGTGGTELIRFRWDNPSVTPGVAPTDIRVTYVAQGGTGGTERQLHRRTCVGATLSSDVLLVHNLDTIDLTYPQVACANTAGVAQSCGTNPAPAKVTLTLKIRAPRNADALTMALVGQRRQT
jgi:prepilin-type N-terminal cleavage/methylation domain-containing protein